MGRAGSGENSGVSVVPLRRPAPQRQAVIRDETEVERAHRAAISIHCPNQDEMTMAARVGIAMLRDQAGTGINRATSPAAAQMLSVASGVAAEAVYAPHDLRQLLRLQAALSLTVEAARAMERATGDGR